MRKKILWWLGSFLLIFLFFLSLLYFNVVQIKKAVINNDFDKASTTANKLLFFTKPLSKLTFQQLSDLELLNTSLKLTAKTPQLLQQTVNIVTNDKQEYLLDLNQVLTIVNNINEDVKNLNSKLQTSLLAKKILTTKEQYEIEELSLTLSDTQVILNELVKKDQKILLVFQNSDEVRATGGFMGSYTILDIKDGKVITVTTEDIYDADGQFKGYFNAPSGVKKYLSSDKGLRLPNANWHPDFPSSAKQILQFFALGNRKNISTLVAINLDYVKTILNIIGEVPLLDYNTVVNSNNINEVLRSKRDDFFPGSQQKKHIISQLLTQMQLKINSLPTTKKLELLKQTMTQTKLHNIQLYSNTNVVDSIYSQRSFRQELKRDDLTDNIFLVESNVGINKANRHINRNVEITSTTLQTTILVHWKNENKKTTFTQLTPLTDNLKSSDLGYINYQRIITNPNWELESIWYDDKKIENWHEEIITNSNNIEFKEVGFITTLPEQQSAELVINYAHQLGIKDKLLIQKQPGIPATVYSITNNDKQKIILLEKDEIAKVF